MKLAALWLGTPLAALAIAAQEPDPAPAPVRPEARPRPDALATDRLPPEAALGVIERAVGYLLERQREDGSWSSSAPDGLFDLGYALESYKAWQLASHGLVCMALAAVEETPERRAALERAVVWLVDTSVPARGSDWDVDSVWAALYGFVACVELLDDERFGASDWSAPLERRGKELLAILRRRQSLEGGWAYYDASPYDRTQTWATSFATALVLPSLARAAERGWDVGEDTLPRAVRFVRRCALPGGAYAYDLTAVPEIGGVEHINRIEGSLGRTQVCNWGLARAGVRSITPDVVRAGLEAFFRHHGFLDHVRTRPVPHEGFHRNAGYFYFFGHYYAARAIGLLPAEEREEWHARLRHEIGKTQWDSGGMSDFLQAQYLVNASTAFAILALREGLDRAVAR